MGFDLSYLKSDGTHLFLMAVCSATVIPPSSHICRLGAKKYERLFYITQGKTAFHLSNGDTLRAEAGDIVYLPYDCTYESHWEENTLGGYITIIFLQRDSTGNIITFGDTINLLLHDKQQNFLHTFTEILQCWQSDSLNATLKCYSFLWGIIYDISVHLERQSIQSTSQTIYPGIVYMENNYLSDFTVEDLAKMCAVSVCTFRRLFRQIKGVSPITYRNRLRMGKAKMLLQSGEYSVSDVSRIVKCANIYYFSRMFKEHFGIAPSQVYPK